MMKNWSRSSLSLQTFLTLMTVVFSVDVYVRVGDMVALHCPNIRGGCVKTPPTWTSFTPHKTDLSSGGNSSSAFLIHKRSLVLLNASLEHGGNYSCSLGNQTFWSTLFVYSAESAENQKRVHYTQSCYVQKSCTLRCPNYNTPVPVPSNMSRLDITWRKDGRLRRGSFFSSVKESDQGTFTCTRSYLYKGQKYNTTFTVALTVKPQGNVEIISPHDSDIFEVALGAPFIINCTATISSDFDDLYWIVDRSSVKSDSPRVFSNYISHTDATERHVTASLIFKKVLNEDLSKNFTCKLESVSVESSFVTISLK